jgi:hypothetical protein
MLKDPTYGPSIDLKEANETGVFRNARYVKTDSSTELIHRFYYILSDAKSKKSKLKIESQSIQMRLTIGRSSMTTIRSKSVHGNKITMMTMTVIVML